MKTNRNYWKETEVYLVGGGFCSRTCPGIRGSAKEIAAFFKSLFTNSIFHGLVFKLRTTWRKRRGCAISLTIWNPNTCQGGRGWNTYTLCYVPKRDDSSTWSSSGFLPDGFHPLKTPMGIAMGLSTLYDIVLSVIPANQLEIGSLEMDLAPLILYWKLRKRATRIEFCAEDDDDDKARRILGLCGNLSTDPESQILSPATLTDLYSDKFRLFHHRLVRHLFRSLDHSRQLKILDLPSERRIHTWSSERKQERSENEPGVPSSAMSKILSALSSAREPGERLQRLDLSGHKISTDAALLLAGAIPELKVDTLLLRDTCLEEDALFHIVGSLEGATSLRFLDLSHSSLGSKVMERLCLSLQHNKILETLLLEHCDLDLGHAHCLAEHLPKMKGLRHLSLNGNDFAWTPLRNSNVSVGATLLVNALEHNLTLQSLRVGDHGHVDPTTRNRLCCTPPSYAPALSASSSRKHHAWLARNARIDQEKKQTRMQQGVIRIAGLLLAKMARITS